MSALPPAPEAWVGAAKDAPFARQRLDEIVERAKADKEYRQRVVDDLESVLGEADVVAHAENIEIIRKRLEDEK
ncbi:MAG: hypothetical protein ACRDNH_13470 [Gaiellaceae bacterium]